MFAVKKSQDIIPILIAVLIFALQLTAIFVPVMWSVVMALMIVYFCGTIAAFQHHHGHCSVFRNKRINEILDSMMSFQTGITPYAWVLHHNIGHHGNYMKQYPIDESENLDASNWSREDGSVMNRWEYVWYNRKRMHSRCTDIGQRSGKIFDKYVRFRRIHFLSIVVFFCLSFWISGWVGLLSTCLLFVAIPQFMVLMIFETTYDHHSGLFTEQKHEASRNILGSFYNFSRLNLGYHTAHHIKPGLHWSELPEYHKKIEHRIPEALIDRNESFVQSLAKTIWAGEK